MAIQNLQNIKFQGAQGIKKSLVTNNNSCPDCHGKLSLSKANPNESCPDCGTDVAFSGTKGAGRKHKPNNKGGKLSMMA